VPRGHAQAIGIWIQPVVGLVLALFSACGFLPQASADPETFAYVLQAERLATSKAAAVQKLARSGRDWMVIDAVYRDRIPWTSKDLARIRAGRASRKVLAYLSIGEAEDYRPYWNPTWDADRDGVPDAAAPDWLLGENPWWSGNYLVKYWQADWQAIILNALAVVLDAGFDGIYLDIVDGFEHFEYDPVTGEWRDDLLNPATGQSYRRDMIDWVTLLADHGRSRGRPDLLVVPQNGEQLLLDPSYVETISAQGVESVFTDGNRRVSAAARDYRLGFLKRLQPVRKPVMLIEYGTTSAARRRSIDGARASGFVLLLTHPQLDRLGVSVP
jgi:cysteinyl-tRNA synthetase